MKIDDVIRGFMLALIAYVCLVVLLELWPQISGTEFGSQVIEGVIQLVFYGMVVVVIVLALDAVIGD